MPAYGRVARDDTMSSTESPMNGPQSGGSWIRPNRTKGARSVGLAAMLAGAVIWSTEGLLVRSLDLPAVSIAAGRLMFVSAVGLGLGLARPGWRGVLTENWRRLTVLGALTAVSSWLFFSAIQLTSVAIAVFLLFTWPVWLLSFYAVARVDLAPLRTWVALLLALIGVVLLVAGGNAESETGDHILGVLAALAASAAVSAMMVILRSFASSVPSAAVFAWESAIAMVFLGPAGLAAAIPTHITTSDLALLAILGIGVYGIGGVMFLIGLRRLSASETAILSYTEPAMATVLAAIVLREAPTIHGVLGIALILAVGIWAAVRGDSRTLTPHVSAGP